jgi:hypothetical protein
MATFNTGPVTPGTGGIGGTPAPNPYVPPPQQQPANNGNWFSNMSPEGQGALVNTGANLLGGYLSQRNQNSQNAQQQQWQAQQNSQQQQAELQKLQMQLEQSRILQEKQMGLQASQAAPQRQDWRQRQALMAAILPELRNYEVQAPGRLAQYQPQISGGFRLPEGGLPAEALQFFSPQARLQAEQDFDRQAALSSGGRMATPDYGAAGYGDALGIPATENVNTYTQSILQEILKQQQPTAGGQSPAVPFQGGPGSRHGMG